MGNPHPTRSKPCKIGRKHTGAAGIRQREKMRRSQKARAEDRKSRGRAYKTAVREFWSGLRDTHPAKGDYI